MNRRTVKNPPSYQHHRQGFFVNIINATIIVNYIKPILTIRIMTIMSSRLGPCSQRPMPLFSLLTTAPSWLPILSLSLNQVGYLVFSS